MRACCKSFALKRVEEISTLSFLWPRPPFSGMTNSVMNGASRQPFRRDTSPAGGEAEIAALILAENVERRNLSAGQRAMARAMLKPEPEKGKRTDLSGNPDKLSRQETNSLSQARFIFRHDEALARSVEARRACRSKGRRHR